MATMLYNGVELPELPVKYLDRCPVRFIVQNPAGVYRLYLCTDCTIFFGNDGTMNNAIRAQNSAGFGQVGYTYTDGEWADWFYDLEAGYTDAFLASDITPIWSSVNILDISDNITVYLPASAPVDPNAPTEPELTHGEVVKWLIVGKLLRRNLMAGVKEATMYSYNGVVLPKLPEWDKTVYPYALIYRDTYSAKKRLCVMANPPYLYRISSGIEDRVNMSDGDYDYELFFVEESDREWTIESWSAGNPHNCPISSVIWTNHDILNKYGSLVFAATDPVPVFE